MALSSSAALTVTVRVAFQFVVVNVRAVSSTVTSAVVPLTLTVTAALGCVFRRMVYVAVRFSRTVRRVGETFRLGVSSSVAVTTIAAVGTPP